MNIRAELERRISEALRVAVGGDAPLPAVVGASTNAKFGDYQANGVMAAAKAAKANPRELATKVLGALDLGDLAEKVEIAGPGFINITLSRAMLAEHANRAAADDRLDVGLPEQPQTVVVDYSAPNLAKEMHVGHLRSTIIGDALANVLEFLGHNVIRQNHVGDWGTQFGMLIAYLDVAAKEGQEPGDALADLEDYYRRAKKTFDEDADFADLARQYVVRLQGGDEYVLARWKQFLEASMEHCEEVYRRLGVHLTRENLRGESFYNDQLPHVIAELRENGLLEESQGAQCVFLPQFTGKDGERLPLIVQKSDGGYLYATTDLAAVRFRARTLHADRILYVTDSRQALHFAQMFAVARKAGFAPENVLLEHVPFGTMLGEDGKPFKTRTGGTVKLVDLLDEAHEKASTAVMDKNPDLPATQREEIAEAVGIGAVKYADLSMDRTSDYKFSWEKMLNLQGNTAPYMQYAYARVRSIFRKGAADAGNLGQAPIVLGEASEADLARQIVRLEETLATAAAESKPNILTSYLYDLASAFSTFYENCPVLKADPATRASRLKLCDLTARVIQRGLNLLGIETIEQM